MTEVRARHPQHGVHELEAARVDYTEHPMYKGKHEDSAVKLTWKKERKK